MKSNITIYCSSASILATEDGEVQLYVKDIDFDRVLESVTNKFTLEQILNKYDKETVSSVVESYINN